MDKQQINIIASFAFSHMCVGMIFYTNHSSLRIEKIKHVSQGLSVSDRALEMVIADLAFHGIISAHIADNHQLYYSITEFGKYYFDELCLANEDIAELCEKMGGNEDEADGAN